MHLAIFLIECNYEATMRKVFIISLILLFSIPFLVAYFDKPAAIFFNSLLLKYSAAGSMPMIPDRLAAITAGIVFFSWYLYLFLLRFDRYRKSLEFFRFLGLLILVSFVMKTFLQFVFGRVMLRTWLADPQAYGFHFFSGGGEFTGFPSGHMTVFTALFCALWVYLPRYRAIYTGCLTVLAFLLVSTSYHYVSDVVAGAITGFYSFLATRMFFKITTYDKKGAEIKQMYRTTAMKKAA